MFDLKGRTALVTGAGSGIGRAIAVSLAGRGCNLALADVNEAGLTETAQPLAGPVRVTRHRLDVADREAVAALPATVAAAHGGLDLLVNNAGVAMAGAFAQVSEADFEWLIEINFWGVVRMTRAFLPMLETAPEARIVNLSSLYGLIAPPGQTAYAASKFAVRGFSQALAHELAGGTVGVTVVHPGGVATSIADSARATAALSAEELERGRRIANSLLTMPPARAGDIIVRGVERRRRRIIIGNDAKIASLIERLMPVSYWGLLSRLKGERR
ncbi:acetoin dehydrogenase [Methylobacterium sp. Leaf87]|uniref:SDR family NAD(P)-dependent oxidoreductase n=1 Tax=Methylobacterium sp. Leaf87 TaxID=1736243 RepID=UPI0006FD0B0B|nr:SDR family oxidoreductase [Methylobacterium sp. Leaf87]KQO62516.1 acetoin dehydrogenase [Methylobacterium sp. Leaf87]